MDDSVHNIKTFGCLVAAPKGHTEHKTRRAPREPRKRGGQAPGRDGKPPPGRCTALCGLLNDRLVAADFANYREIGRLFLFLRHFVGCRSPPLQSVFF